jgi:hypothetical protein
MNAYRTFYIAQTDETSSEKNGTIFMRTVQISTADVVGVMVQQSDLPMVQFFVNGEPINDLAVHRFRGTVYPAIYLPPSESMLHSSQIGVKLVFLENEFQFAMLNSRPLLLARGLV